MWVLILLKALACCGLLVCVFIYVCVYIYVCVFVCAHMHVTFAYTYLLAESTEGMVTAAIARLGNLVYVFWQL